MSDFFDAILELLPLHSNLQKTDNAGRKVLENTIGEWFDNHNVLDLYNNLFLQDATGGYLDLFGKDYNVIRQLGESDDDYRDRIVYTSLKHLTVDYLKEVYSLDLYYGISDFDATENTLTSDNPYIVSSKGFMSVGSDDIKNTLNNQLTLDEAITWL